MVVGEKREKGKKKVDWMEIDLMGGGRIEGDG